MNCSWSMLIRNSPNQLKMFSIKRNKFDFISMNTSSSTVLNPYISAMNNCSIPLTSSFCCISDEESDFHCFNSSYVWAQGNSLRLIPYHERSSVGNWIIAASALPIIQTKSMWNPNKTDFIFFEFSLFFFSSLYYIYNFQLNKLFSFLFIWIFFGTSIT